MVDRKSWKALVVTDLPQLMGPGNVILQIFRPYGDTHEMPCSEEIDAGIPTDLLTITARINLHASDLSGRRMINGIKRMRDGKDTVITHMNRLLQGMDFTPARIAPPEKPASNQEVSSSASTAPPIQRQVTL